MLILSQNMLAQKLQAAFYGLVLFIDIAQIRFHEGRVMLPVQKIFQPWVGQQFYYKKGTTDGYCVTCFHRWRYLIKSYKKSIIRPAVQLFTIPICKRMGRIQCKTFAGHNVEYDATMAVSFAII